jgi:hypothetical protein
MIRHSLTLLACVALGAPAAFAQNGFVLPTSTSEVGPWEAAVWTRDRVVLRCTMARTRSTPKDVNYGILIDSDGILLGVANRNWKFATQVPMQATLAPQDGGARTLTARPVSNIRANIDLPREMLDQLQRSEHADVQIGDSKVRLPFDDFNAARVTLEICVQKIGKKN